VLTDTKTLTKGKTMKRRKIPRQQSRKNFTKHAFKIHKKKAISPQSGPMRGGIRL
jgi:hypothetical protein